MFKKKGEHIVYGLLMEACLKARFYRFFDVTKAAGFYLEADYYLSFLSPEAENAVRSSKDEALYISKKKVTKAHKMVTSVYECMPDDVKNVLEWAENKKNQNVAFDISKIAKRFCVDVQSDKSLVHGGETVAFSIAQTQKWEHRNYYYMVARPLSLEDKALGQLFLTVSLGVREEKAEWSWVRSVGTVQLDSSMTKAELDRILVEMDKAKIYNYKGGDFSYAYHLLERKVLTDMRNIKPRHDTRPSLS